MIRSGRPRPVSASSFGGTPLSVAAGYFEGMCTPKIETACPVQGCLWSIQGLPLTIPHSMVEMPHGLDFSILLVVVQGPVVWGMLMLSRLARGVHAREAEQQQQQQQRRAKLQRVRARPQ